MSKENQYPEHAKLRAVRSEHASISEFFEWLESNGYEVCKPSKTQNNLTAVKYDSFRPDKIIAEFFDIDAKKLEAEKQAMIASL